MDSTLSLQLTLAFGDSTSRNFKFTGIDQITPATLRNRIKAINANVPANFANTFVSDTGAQCVMISSATVINVEEEVIYNAS